MNRNIRPTLDRRGNAPVSNSEQEKRDFKGIIFRLLSYVFAHPFLFITAIALTLISNQLALLGPEYSGSAVDAIVEESGVNMPLVLTNVIKMIVCYVFSSILSYLLSVVMVTLGQKIVYTMRREVFEKLSRLPVGYFDKNPTGDIISRISYDIDTVNATLSHDLVQVMTSL